MDMANTDGNSWRSHTDAVTAADPAEADVHVDTIRQGVHQPNGIGETPILLCRLPQWHIRLLCDMYTCIHVIGIPRHTQAAIVCSHVKIYMHVDVISMMPMATYTQRTDHATDG